MLAIALVISGSPLPPVSWTIVVRTSAALPSPAFRLVSMRMPLPRLPLFRAVMFTFDAVVPSTAADTTIPGHALIAAAIAVAQFAEVISALTGTEMR